MSSGIVIIYIHKTVEDNIKFVLDANLIIQMCKNGFSVAVKAVKCNDGVKP